MSAFLLLGSNQGDSLSILQQACRMINERVGQMVRTSSLYATKAWGQTQQPDFLNQVLEVNTSLAPEAILSVCQEIEKQLGRKRFEKWGPRYIDIDILYYGDQVIATETLVVPHPQIAFRRFTLAPLAEIASDFVHPILGKTQKQLLDDCRDGLEVLPLAALPSHM